MVHIAYPKIKHLDAEETFWILDYYCYVQEKLDGANLSVWLENWDMYVGSRSQIVGSPKVKEGFRGAVEYCMNHKGIAAIFNHYPNYRLFGEWLVKHSIPYPQECYQKFYLYDMFNEDTKEFLTPNIVCAIAREFWVNYPEILLEWKMLSPEQIKEVVGTSKIAQAWEGVVIKAPEFTNKFFEKQYAKMVTENFKEANKLSFGCSAKHDIELNFATTFVSIPRLLKIINKIEQGHDRKVKRSDIPQLLWMMWHDVFTEELWGYVKKHHEPTIDFKKMERYVTDRTKILFFDWLEQGVLTSHNTNA